VYIADTSLYVVTAVNYYSAGSSSVIWKGCRHRCRFFQPRPPVLAPRDPPVTENDEKGRSLSPTHTITRRRRYNFLLACVILSLFSLSFPSICRLLVTCLFSLRKPPRIIYTFRDVEFACAVNIFLSFSNPTFVYFISLLQRSWKKTTRIIHGVNCSCLYLNSTNNY